MKKIFVAGILSGALLLLLAACGDDPEEKVTDLIYGQIININETSVTVERGDYSDEGSFKGSHKEITYNLPEAVFYDDFQSGDIVAVLFDGRDATMITDTKGISNASENESRNVSGGKSGETLYRYLSAVNTVDGSKKIFNGSLYESKAEDVSAVLVKNSSILTMGGGIMDKTGDASNIDAVEYYGLNSALAVISGSQVDIKDSVIKSNAIGADGIMVGGLSSKVILQSGTVSTYGNYSSGLAVIDGGTAELDGTDINTSGENSPCIYSSGNTSVANSKVDASKSSIAAIEGANNLSLKNCELVGAGDNGLYFYQRATQEIPSLKGRLIIRNSKIQYEADGALICVEGANATAVMWDTELAFGSGILAEVSGSTNDTAVAGKLILKGIGQKFTGIIKCDKNSKVKLILKENSTFTGAVDTENTAAYSKIYLSGDSCWNVTADSYVGSLTDEKTTCSNIKSNGHNIYYKVDNTANHWLGGKTVDLPGGGRLIPVD